MPNKWRTIKSLVHKIRLTLDEGKERLNPSREKNKGMHRRRTVEKSCVTFLPGDPGWYVHKPDAQNNKRDDNTHTYTHITNHCRRKMEVSRGYLFSNVLNSILKASVALHLLQSSLQQNWTKQ